MMSAMKAIFFSGIPVFLGATGGLANGAADDSTILRRKIFSIRRNLRSHQSLRKGAAQKESRNRAALTALPETDAVRIVPQQWPM